MMSLRFLAFLLAPMFFIGGGYISTAKGARLTLNDLNGGQAKKRQGGF